jgi:hypothetical protein
MNLPQVLPSAQNRYRNEVTPLYRVLDRHLAKRVTLPAVTSPLPILPLGHKSFISGANSKIYPIHSAFCTGLTN